MKSIIQTAAAILGALTGFLFGDCDGVFIALLCFVVIDYITGVIHAAVTRTVSSKTGFKGLLKKFLILLIVSVGHLVDVYLIGSGTMIRDACCLFYISNEGISILENVIAMGVPVPEKLRVILEQLDKKEEINNDRSSEG